MVELSEKYRPDTDETIIEYFSGRFRFYLGKDYIVNVCIRNGFDQEVDPKHIPSILRSLADFEVSLEDLDPRQSLLIKSIRSTLIGKLEERR